MEAITASLERSLQNCSLNNHNHQSSSSRREQDAGIGISSSSDDVLPEDNNNNDNLNHDGLTVSNSDTTLELNSHISLPYHWEQCLDLKTGEIYYINWRNGMKAKEDPRRVEASREYSNNNSTTIRDYYESDQDEEEEEEEDGWYDSEESSSESCPSSSKEGQNSNNNNNSYNHNNNKSNNNNNSNVLVVAGCKSCLMYFMVPKQVEDCPKCNGQLLHFDRSENGSP